MIGDDLALFFVADEFAHADDQLNGVDVLGIFDEKYVRTGGGFGMADMHRAYHISSCLVPPAPVGMTLRHKGKFYTVVDDEADEGGVTVLILETA